MLRRFFKVSAFLLLVLLVLLVALYYCYNRMLEAVDPAAAEVYSTVNIPAGANAANIAEILYQNDLIKNELAFRLFVRRHNLGKGFIAGEYLLSPAMSLEQIVSKIQAGEVYVETAWFTIPEGYTVEEIAERLEKQGLANSKLFLDLARSPSENILSTFSFLMEIDNQDIDYLLEGYLFPDTYEIYTNAGEEEIINTMLRRMDQVVNEKYRQRIIELNSSLHEILTIASLIEREARVDHERSIISSVIYNRLKIGQRLQIDATIQYILEETKEFLLFKDLEVESPYNTYQNDGLPPGPIAAPGEASIYAALYPDSTDYYYYNYKYDNTGEHYFSRTLQEHNENVKRAEANIQ